MTRTAKCLACGNSMTPINPRGEDRSRENNLCPTCYAQETICVCGCGEVIWTFNSRGNRRKFFLPSHYYNVPEKRDHATQLQGIGMKKAWQRASYRDPKVGKNHPNWKGGIWGYPAECSKALKLAIKERDGFKCQNPRCQHKNRPLHTHHIDGDKQNNAFENLVTLCDHCHHALHPVKHGPPVSLDELL